MIANGTPQAPTATDTQVAETSPTPTAPGFPPSVWAGVWVIGALAYLAFARKSFGKLG